MTKQHLTKIINIFSLVILVLLIPHGSYGQNTDPLKKAKSLNEKRDFEAAEKLLQRYVADHPKDLYGGWLYAHTLHLNHRYYQSQRVYTKMINLFPYNYDLQLDQINKLAEMGRLDKAIQQTNAIMPKLPKAYYYLAQKTLAQLYFWKGDYDRANTSISAALRIYPTEKAGIELREQIANARSNWMETSLDVFTDDQPLTVITPDVKAMFYLNSMVSVGAGIRYPIHILSENNYALPQVALLSNFNFIESGIGVKLSAGGVHFPTKDNALSAAVEVNKRFLRYLTVSAKLDYHPYLATTFAIKNKLMETTYGLDLDWNNPKGFSGYAGYGNNIFSGLDNGFQVVSGWLVSPPLKVSSFSFRAGYGINYSDSKTNTFTAKESLDSILVHWDTAYVIEGNYQPFFSPNNQLIHSLVGMIGFKPNEKMSFGVDINYGISAHSDAPYLFLDESGEETVIGRDFERTEYHPMDINAYANYQISKNFIAKAFYKHQKTFYYQSDLIGITANFTF